MHSKVRHKLLSQGAKFKYFGVILTSLGQVEQDTDKQAVAASAVMWALLQ